MSVWRYYQCGLLNTYQKHIIVLQNMGAAQTQGVQTDIPLQHPYLRNCRALTKNKLTFLVSSVAVQKPQFQKWKEELFEFQKQSADCQWLMLPLKQKYEEGGVCSTTGELKLEYEYYPKLLSTQITDRTLEKRKFNEAELWYLLYVLVTARQALISQGYVYGDLQPRNVFLNANQQVRVGCILSWPGEISAYRKVVQEQDFGYLSPEDIERLKLGAMDNKNNTESEIFAIGLTLLSTSSLQPMRDLYRIKQREFDEQLFSARLSAFQQDRTYSDIFRAVVSNLLEVDLLKRMNQKQLYQFLSKHKDSLAIKKPLVFDNVGRKLQQSINQLLRILPNNRLPQPPPQLLEQTPPVQPKEVVQKSLKQSASFDKKMGIAINQQINQMPLPVSPRTSNPILINNITFNSSPSQPFYQQYPIQIPHSPRSLYPVPKINENPQNQQKIQTVQSPQKFSPFNMISTKNDKVINQAAFLIAANGTKITRQISPNGVNDKRGITSNHQSRVNELKSQCEQKSLVGQLNLLMQTRRGLNIVQVVEVKRKERGSESRISETSKLHQNSFIKSNQQSELHIQKQVQQVKQVDNKQITVQHSEKPQPHKQILIESPKFKETSVVVEASQIAAESIKQKPEKNHQPNKQSVSTLPLDSKEQLPFQTVAEPKKQVVKQQEDKAPKFSPLIKVWGTQKGHLTIQQFSKSNQKNPQQQKQVTFSKQTTVTHLKQHQNPIKVISDSETAKKSTPESLKSQQQVDSLIDIKIEKEKAANYILIEEPSQTTQKEEHSKQIQRSEASQVDYSKSKAKSVSQSASEARNRFMYIDISSNGSYQECWKQLQHMIQQPALYCSKVKPEKVHPIATELGRFLKLGPARVKIDVNKQNGKIWLQNIHGSSCEGQILCGVLKGKDMQHYIWFNSSYTYKGNHFPSRQILEEALAVAKNNIETRLNSSRPAK